MNLSIDRDAKAIVSIPLNRLKLDPEKNARRNGKSEEEPALQALAANIDVEGQLYPLLVYPEEGDGLFPISDGGRRYAAQLLRVKAGKIGEDAPIDCIIRERATAEAEEIGVSLSANMREALHPVDAFEAFQRLLEGGMTVAGIARRYGETEGHVRQRLALAGLAPEIREAWRRGELAERGASARQAQVRGTAAEDFAFEIAAAFTIAPNLETQRDLFLALKASGELNARVIRRELRPDDARETRKLLNFVGAAAYEAAGGRLQQDLFGEDVFVSDFPLLRRLAGDRLDAEAAALKAKGWGEALIAAEFSAEHLARLKDVPLTEDRLIAAQTEEEAALRANAARLMEVTAEAHERVRRLREEATGDGTSDELAERESAWRDADDASTGASNDVETLNETLRLRIFESDDTLRAGAACLLSIGADGRLIVRAGVVRSRPTAPPASDDASARAVALASSGPLAPSDDRAPNDGGEDPSQQRKEAAKLSPAVFRSLTETMTNAARAVIEGRHALALAIAVAALDGVSSPSTIGYRGAEGRLDFGKRLKDLANEDATELMRLFAFHVARSIDFKSANPIAWPGEAAAALLENLPGPALDAEILKRFDAEAFFKSAGKLAAIDAIAESAGENEAASWQRKRAREVIAFAADKAKEESWLPPPLRTQNYHGPNGRPVSKAQKAAARRRQRAGVPTADDVPDASKGKGTEPSDQRREASTSVRPKAPASQGADSAEGLNEKTGGLHFKKITPSEKLAMPKTKKRSNDFALIELGRIPPSETTARGKADRSRRRSDDAIAPATEGNWLYAVKAQLGATAIAETLGFNPAEPGAAAHATRQAAIEAAANALREQFPEAEQEALWRWLDSLKPDDCHFCGAAADMAKSAPGSALCSEHLAIRDHVVSHSNHDGKALALCACGWRDERDWGGHREAQDAAVKAHWQAVVDKAQTGEAA